MIDENSLDFLDSRIIRQVVQANCKRLREERNARLAESKRQKDIRDILPTDPRDWFKLHQAHQAATSGGSASKGANIIP